MAEDIERNLIRLSESEAERLVKFYAEAERRSWTGLTGRCYGEQDRIPGPDEEEY